MTVRHDLRNCLATIIGYATLAQEAVNAVDDPAVLPSTLAADFLAIRDATASALALLADPPPAAAGSEIAEAIPPDVRTSRGGLTLT